MKSHEECAHGRFNTEVHFATPDQLLAVADDTSIAWQSTTESKLVSLRRQAGRATPDHSDAPAAVGRSRPVARIPSAPQVISRISRPKSAATWRAGPAISPGVDRSSPKVAANSSRLHFATPGFARIPAIKASPLQSSSVKTAFRLARVISSA